MITQESSVQQQASQLVFDPILPQATRQALNNAQILNALNQNQLSISCTCYLQAKWNLIFPYIKSAPFTNLSISFCNYGLQDQQQVKIIIEISQPNYIQLKQLSLGWNHITSIECIQFLNMPFLEQLNLRNNKIKKTNALNKCTLTSLKHLSLFYNMTTQTNFSRLRITNNFFQETTYRGDHLEGDKQISMLVKMNFNQVSLWSFGKHIQPTPRKLRALEQKKLQIQFSKYRA